MIQIVRCESCEKELSIPADDRAKDIIHLELKMRRTWPSCDHCHRWAEEKRTCSFCSPECFKKYCNEGMLDAHVDRLK